MNRTAKDAGINSLEGGNVQSTIQSALLRSFSSIAWHEVRTILFCVVVVSAAALLSASDVVAQCGTCGCPPGQDCYCNSESDCYCVEGTPIIIDLRGDGFKLTGPSGGVQFDFFLNGPVQISWTPPDADEGWLVLPPSDGKIVNGAEMFGNLTPQPPSDDPNGFSALAVYDEPKNGGNGDGIIDSRDAIFSRLRIWRDSNHNGISEPWELISLTDAGIKSISLNYTETGYVDKWGNRFRYRARVVSTDGADKWAYDVILQFTKPSATSKTVGAGGSQTARADVSTTPGQQFVAAMESVGTLHSRAPQGEQDFDRSADLPKRLRSRRQRSNHS